MTIGICEGLVSPSVGGGPVAQAYITDLAIAAGAKHVWGASPAPLEDAVGALDLTESGGGAIPLPGGLEGVHVSYGTATTTGPSVAGVSMDRSADRSWMIAFRIPAASGHNALLQIGRLAVAGSLGQLTIRDSTGFIRWWDNTWNGGAFLNVLSYAAHVGKWLVIHGKFDEATSTHTLYWTLDAGEESTDDVVGTPVGTPGTCTVYAGGDGAAIFTPTAPYTWGVVALADGHALAGTAFRAAVAAALWPA